MTPTLELNIKLPRCYGAAATAMGHALASGGTTTLVHASLRGRFPALGLAVALFAFTTLPAEKTNFVGLLAPRCATLRFLLNEWMERAGHPLRRRFGSGALKCAEIQDGQQLWLLEPDDAEAFPRAVLHHLIVLDCHALERRDVQFFRSINRGGLILMGNMPDRDHWFYRQTQDPVASHLNLTAKIVCTAFPDQLTKLAEERKKMDRTTAARMLDLQDIQHTGSIPVTRFARERLWLRSDKDKRFFTPEQDAVAKKADGTPLVPFHVSPLQKRYLAAKRLAIADGKPSRFLLLKFRRGGFTSLEQGESYKTWATRPRSWVATLAHTSEATQRIFSIVKTFHENDPYSPNLVGVGNAKRLDSAVNHSSFFIGTAGSSGFARGDTLQRVHGSEVAYWCEGPNQYEKVNKLIAGLTEACSNGEVVLETTPNGMDWFCATYKEAKQGLNNFTPIFLPWFADPANRALASAFNETEIRETLSDREKFLIETFGLDFAQIAFRRMKNRENRTLFPQEYPEDDVSCFLASGTRYFDHELVQSRSEALAKCKPATKKHVPGGFYYEMRPYDPEKDANRRFCIGSDTSEGIPGCDPSGYGIVDWETGEQRAWLHGLFKPGDLGRKLHAASKKWNDAIIGCERNNHGHAVLQRIVDLGGPQSRSHELGGCLYCFSRERQGWDTNGTTRPLILARLSEALEERAKGWNDPLLLEEMTTFRKQSDGSWGADPNCHDDTIFKWGIAEQMRSVPVHRTTFGDM